MKEALQAFAAGLQPDSASWRIGRADGERSAPWRPPEGCDGFSYALGYLDAQRFSDRCCEGSPLACQK